MKVLIVTGLIAVLLFSCKKEKTPGNEPKKPIVYISGWVKNAEGTTTSPCYWKDTSLIKLDISSGSWGTTWNMIVANGDIYVLGTYSLNGGTTCLWKNGIRTDLTAPAGKSAFGSKLFISGTDVYVGGYSFYNSKYKPCYWKNGQYNEIAEVNDDADVTCISVSGSDIYLGGTIVDPGTGNSTGCYWKNGVRIDLPGLPSGAYADINDITLQGSTVFVSGSASTASGSRNAIIWKNNILNNIGPDIYCEANGIDVAGDQVYTCGYYLESSLYVPCYWENGIRSTLPQSASVNNSIAHSIKQSGPDIYIAGRGNMISNQNIFMPCAWKNGQLIPLSMGNNSGGAATSVFIAQ